MFSQACVENSAHSGEVYNLLDRHPPEQTSPQADGYCSGRYASYWNAFLFGRRFINDTATAVYKISLATVNNTAACATFPFTRLTSQNAVLGSVNPEMFSLTDLVPKLVMLPLRVLYERLNNNYP